MYLRVLFVIFSLFSVATARLDVYPRNGVNEIINGIEEEVMRLQNKITQILDSEINLLHYVYKMRDKVEALENKTTGNIPELEAKVNDFTTSFNNSLEAFQDTYLTKADGLEKLFKLFIDEKSSSVVRTKMIFGSVTEEHSVIRNNERIEVTKLHTGVIKLDFMSIFTSMPVLLTTIGGGKNGFATTSDCGTNDICIHTFSFDGEPIDCAVNFVAIGN